MRIEKIIDTHTQQWIVSAEGFCYYETHGPSMTDWARFYPIEELLALRDKERIQAFEKGVPKELGGLLGIFEALRLEREAGENMLQLPQIKARIEELR